MDEAAATDAELPGEVRPTETVAAPPPADARPPRPPRRANVRLPALPVASEPSGGQVADATQRSTAGEDVENPRDRGNTGYRYNASIADEELEQLIREGFEKIRKMPRRIRLVDYQPKVSNASDIGAQPEEQKLQQQPDTGEIQDPRTRQIMDELAVARKQAAALTEVQKKLEDIEIATLSGKVKMIGSDSLPTRNTPMHTQLLYLTNQQAHDFDFSATFFTLLRELQIPTPGLVINLMPAHGGLAMENVHYLASKLDQKRYSELNKEELLATSRRIKVFIRECVLPVAVENNALVLINDTACALSRAFAEVMGDFCAGGQQKAPFTILHIGCAYANAAACDDPGCHANALRAHWPNWQNSPAWAKMIKKQDVFRPASKDGSTQTRHFLGGPDMLPQCDAFVIIEGVDADGNPDAHPWSSFYTRFVKQQVIHGWPNITFGTFSVGDVSAVADVFVDRGLRFMFLDTRLPPAQQGDAIDADPTSWTSDGYATSFEDAQRYLERFEYDLIRRGASNWYDMCTLGNLHAVYDHVLQCDLAPEITAHGPSTAPVQTNHRISTSGPKGKFIGQLIRQHEIHVANRHKKQKQINSFSKESDSPALQATLVLEKMRLLRRNVYYRWALMLLTEEWMPALDAIKQDDLAGLNAWLAERSLDCRLYLPNMVGNGIHTTPMVDWIRRVMKRHGPQADQAYCVEELGHAETAMGLPGTKPLSVNVLRLNREVVEPALIPVVLTAMRSILQAMQVELEHLMHVKLTEHEVHGDIEPKLRKLITDSKVYHGNINDVKAMKEKIHQISTLSRLPDKNSPEAIRILAQVWDAVDVFSFEANKSKMIAKASYFGLLVIAMLITFVTVSSLNSPQMVIKQGEEYCPDGTGNYTACDPPVWWHMSDVARGKFVAGLSLAASLLTSVTAYLDPQQRWSVLRCAALELSSEVWKFRTRKGDYATVNGSSKEAECYLQSYLTSIKGHVQKSGSVSKSQFYSRFELFGGRVLKTAVKPSGDSEMPLVLDRAPRKLSIYTHGQYPNAHGTYEGRVVQGTFGDANLDHVGDIIDDHQSPCTCEEYLRLRVEPMVAFYQSRLPGYYHRRSAFEVVLLLGALSGALLAFLNLDHWSAVFTSVSSFVMSWMGFTSLSDKITRYSNCVDKVGGELLKWRSLTSVEQARLDRQTALVMECEELFARERDAWHSTSAHQKPLPAGEVAPGDAEAGKLAKPASA